MAGELKGHVVDLVPSLGLSGSGCPSLRLIPRLVSIALRPRLRHSGHLYACGGGRVPLMGCNYSPLEGTQ